MPPFECTSTIADISDRFVSNARAQMYVIMCGTDGFMSIRCSNRILMCAFVCCGQFTSVTCKFNITRSQISYIQLDLVWYFIDYSPPSPVVYLFSSIHRLSSQLGPAASQQRTPGWQSDYKLINTTQIPCRLNEQLTQQQQQHNECVCVLHRDLGCR